MEHAVKYIKGLFQSRKRNIERMTEQVVDSDYYNIQHFISELPWDARKVFDKVSVDTSNLLNSFDGVGLLIDESALSKKGEYSVGISRQYNGNAGKVDNCQVAVYATLTGENHYGLIDTELFLPESWTDDKHRCKKAGVPNKRLQFKSKLELALDILKRQRALGTKYGWIGADGFYGNSSWFLKKLDELNELFVIDIQKVIQRCKTGSGNV